MWTVKCECDKGCTRVSHQLQVMKHLVEIASELSISNCLLLVKHGNGEGRRVF